MKRQFLFAGALLLGGVLVLPYLWRWSRWERIRGREGDKAAETLPADAVVLSLAKGKFTAPFQRVPTPSSVSGYAAAIPQGQGTKPGHGRLAMPFRVPRAGSRRIWLRCLWMDGCGNSVTIGIDDEPLRTVGQDGVYNVWHWIDAGAVALAAGEHTLRLGEREDGIAIDQALLTTAGDFIPGGPILDGRMQPDIRRFADAFDRSPGHGSPDWDFAGGDWHIAFTLDPNRIPHQYSLEVSPKPDATARARVRGGPWRGFRFSCSVLPDADSRFGFVLDFFAGNGRENALLTLGAAPEAEYDPAGKEPLRKPLPRLRLRPGQWHRLVLERWGWSARLRLDGTTVLERDDLDALPLVPGLLAGGGKVVFDDVRIVEIPWQGDDGNKIRTAWTPGAQSRWYRPRQPRPGLVLRGTAGELTATTFWDRPIREIFVWSAVPPEALDIADFVCPEKTAAPPWKYVLRAPAAKTARALTLRARKAATLQRIGWRYAIGETDAFRIGPYTFTTAEIPDPADYLDFTPAEKEAIYASPDAQKLIRKPKYVSLVGKNEDYAVWGAESGSWKVENGALHGAGAGARLRFWQEIETDADLHLDLKLDQGSAAAVLLAENPRQAIRVVLGPAAAPDSREPAAAVPADNGWHAVHIALRNDQLAVGIDGREPRRFAVKRGTGGGILLGVEAGRAHFDNIELLVPRETPQARFYAFDRRETDWWRLGKTWMDHGGIACALASNWISLIAPESEGLLENKQRFPDAVLLACNIEENSKWFGWEKTPTHVHYPFDNIRLCLAPETGSPLDGYRAEVNIRGHAAAVLFRKGIEVARAPQNAAFPIRYVGGHAPYQPRRNRLKLIRQGKEITLVVNGKIVLSYTDSDPIPTARVALGGYRTHVNFSRVVVRRLAPSPPATHP